MAFTKLTVLSQWEDNKLEKHAVKRIDYLWFLGDCKQSWHLSVTIPCFTTEKLQSLSNVYGLRPLQKAWMREHLRLYLANCLELHCESFCRLKVWWNATPTIITLTLRTESRFLSDWILIQFVYSHSKSIKQLLNKLFFLAERSYISCVTASKIQNAMSERLYISL